MLVDDILEIVIPVISITIPIVYHLYFFGIYFIFPKFTNFGRQIITRKKWLNWVMFTKGEEIIGVQTFRNAMMASSFLASLCSALAFYVRINTHLMIKVITLAKKESDYLKEIQLYSLSIIFFLSFLLLAFNVRYILHTSFLVSAKDMSHVDSAIRRFFLSPESRENRREKKEKPKEEQKEQEIIDVPGFGVIDPLRIENILTAERNILLATICYTLGVRLIIYGVPIALWSGLGIYGMLISSCLIIIVFIIYDHI